MTLLLTNKNHLFYITKLILYENFIKFPPQLSALAKVNNNY